MLYIFTKTNARHSYKNYDNFTRNLLNFFKYLKKLSNDRLQQAITLYFFLINLHSDTDINY